MYQSPAEGQSSGTTFKDESSSMCPALCIYSCFAIRCHQYQRLGGLNPFTDTILVSRSQRKCAASCKQGILKDVVQSMEIGKRACYLNGYIFSIMPTDECVWHAGDNITVIVAFLQPVRTLEAIFRDGKHSHKPARTFYGGR